MTKNLTIFQKGAFFLVLIILTNSSSSRGLRKNRETKLLFYDTFKTKNLIERRVIIWHEGGVYSTMNSGNSFKGLPAGWKRKGGESGWGKYSPKAGDAGTIVHVSFEKGRNKYIYLLNIGEYRQKNKY